MENNYDEFATTEPFPATNDIDELGKLAGTEIADEETLSLEEKLEKRDRDRYELDSDSAQDH
jgi:hypothetical protein